MALKSIASQIKPKSFAQPKEPNVTGNRIGNLKHYAHPPKGRHVKTKAPKVRGDDYNPQHNPDYKPQAALRPNIRTTEKSVAGVNMGTSDDKSEGIGMDLGPATATPKAYKPKKTPKRQMTGAAGKMSGTPFFGGAI